MLEASLRVERLIRAADEAYRTAPEGLRSAVLRSGAEIVPALDRYDASTELALAAAAAVSAGLFSMVRIGADDGEEAAVLRCAYFRLVGIAVDKMLESTDGAPS